MSSDSVDLGKKSSLPISVPAVYAGRNTPLRKTASPPVFPDFQHYVKEMIKLQYDPFLRGKIKSKIGTPTVMAASGGIFGGIPYPFMCFPFLNPALNLFNPALNIELAKNLRDMTEHVSFITQAVEKSKELRKDSAAENIPDSLKPRFTPETILEVSKGRITKRRKPGLRHLEELSKIRRQRAHYFRDVKQISECRLCGTCSFACTTKFLGTFMRQHLYTHADRALFTCTKCADFQCSSRDKASKHAWKHHGDDQSTVTDHRYEMDQILTETARQCFGMLIVENGSSS